MTKPNKPEDALRDVIQSFVHRFLGPHLPAKKLATLCTVVFGIVESESVVPAVIGRHLQTGALTKHNIKLVDRYLGNIGFDAKAVARGLLDCFDFTTRQRVPVTIDWTLIGQFWLITASVVMGSRALPFFWAFTDTDRTRMALAQEAFIDEIVDLLPCNVEFVMLFDAGFDEGDFLKYLLAADLRFIVRFSRSNMIRPIGQEKFIKFKPSTHVRGQLYDWGDVEYTDKHKLTGVRCVSTHDHGMKEPWLLITNVNYDPDVVVKMYGRRFETEETYKDFKDIRFGMQLKKSRITSPDRLLRLVVAQTVAYYVMVLCGIWGEHNLLHLKEQANTVKDRRVLSLWRLGRKVLRLGLGRAVLRELVRLLREFFRGFIAKFGGATPCPQSNSPCLGTG